MGSDRLGIELFDVPGQHWQLRPVRRVPVQDLREVRPGAQREPRRDAAGLGRVIPGPWSRDRPGRESGTAPGAGAPNAGVRALRGAIGQATPAPATGEEVAQLYCRVCGDCEGGPWLLDEDLGCLICEACDDGMALLAVLDAPGRVAYWRAVQLLLNGNVLTGTEFDDRPQACDVCEVPIGKGMGHSVYRHAGAVRGRCCLECGAHVRYAAYLGPLRAELVKAHARRLQAQR